MADGKPSRTTSWFPLYAEKTREVKKALDNITLSPFNEEQYHRFFRGYVQDPMMSSQPFRYNREQIDNSYRYNYGGYQKGYAHYGIFLNNEPVGSFQLKRIDPEKQTCEFGIILQCDRYKNRGIGTEAVRIGMEIARTDFCVKTIYGDTMGRNIRMKRVFEKLGFELTETVHNAYQLPEGGYEDRLIWKKQLEENC